MRTLFVPKEFIAPNPAHLPSYTLHLIETKNAIEDWLVIRKNAHLIRKQRGGGSTSTWPIDFPLEANYNDLAWLELCAKSNQLYSYIFRNAKQDYVGCCYIYPIEVFNPDKIADFDVDFSYWVAQEEFDKGMYDKVWPELCAWLEKEWPFDNKRIYLRNVLIPKK